MSQSASSYDENHPIARWLASVGTSASGLMIAGAELPLLRVLSLAAIGLAAYGGWLFLHVWLRAVLAGDADRRVADMQGRVYRQPPDGDTRRSANASLPARAQSWGT